MHNRSLLYSLWQLIWRPGHFISDYINGKRQVSFPPVKMLIILGIISVVVDYLFKAPDITEEVINEDSPLLNQYFDWVEASPGWGWLSVVCFFIIPTWCIFRYAPRNTKHSLPQGFFIQVFMSIQVLIVDDLADFFSSYFYYDAPIVLSLCLQATIWLRLLGKFVERSIDACQRLYVCHTRLINHRTINDRPHPCHQDIPHGVFCYSGRGFYALGNVHQQIACPTTQREKQKISHIVTT